VVDMAHVAGLVAAGLYPNPVPHADVVTSTTHKSLRGPRGGIILMKDAFAKQINSAIFPGLQGGPLMHVIAAKAVALRIAASESFRERQRRTVEGARALAEVLVAESEPDLGAQAVADTAPAPGAAGLPQAPTPLSQSHQPIAGGVKVLTGGTDVHLVLVDLRDVRPELTGRQAEDRLHDIGITVNRNAVPFDPRPPMEASGLRIGTAALATRGLQREDFVEIGEIIADALSDEFEQLAPELTARVKGIVERYPLYESLAAAV